MYPITREILPQRLNQSFHENVGTIHKGVEPETSINV